MGMNSDIQTEKIIFNNILKNPKYLNSTKENFFENQHISLLFKIQKKFFELYKKTGSKENIKRVVSSKKLDETLTPQIIDSIMDITLDEYDDDWLRVCTESWIKWRSMHTHLVNAITYAQTENIDLNNVQDVVDRIQSIVRDGSSVDLGNDLFLDFSQLEDHKSLKRDSFSTGYNFIDETMGGGFIPGTLNVLIGAPKCGKCVVGSEFIKIKNKNTGEIIIISIKDFYNKVKNNKEHELNKCINFIKENLHKFIDSIDIDDWLVETDTGWSSINKIGKTIEYNVFEIKTINFSLKCADNHIVFDSNYKEIYVKDLKIFDYIQTANGLEKIIDIIKFDYCENMYDLQLDDKNHRYYTSGILSHNSTWLNNFAANGVRNGKNVVVITLELLDNQYLQRLSCNLLDIKSYEYEQLLNQKNVLEKKIQETIIFGDGINKFGNLFIKAYGASTASANDLEIFIKNLEIVKGLKIDLVVIDYINIMKNWRNPNSENTYMKIKQISEDLKAMAQRNKWAIMSATQINRTNMGASDIFMTDVSESMGLVHTVDTLYGIILSDLMRAENEYILKALALRNADGMDTAKKFKVDFFKMKIIEDMTGSVILPGQLSGGNRNETKTQR